MLTPQIANLVTFFYPLGNTPAVSLTQGLPLERQADVLLLGSGDVRHILFTVHMDRELPRSSDPPATYAHMLVDRPLDITCCDVEKAIIARNILLLSLIVDDIDGANDMLHWNLYYHFRIDDISLQLLRTQAQKLVSLSSSLQTWHESKYGKLIRVCDHGSLEEVRELWSFYAIERKGEDLSNFQGHHEACLRKSNEYTNQLGTGMNLTGFRSLSPVQIPSIGDLDTLHKHYWIHGSTDLDQSTRALAVHANPMFMSPDDNVVLHYGTNPLLGFHLATAYVPLTRTSPLFQSSAKATSLEKVVAAAKTEFYSWVTSFRKYAHSVKLRFFVGDAVAFSYSLQHRKNTKSTSPAHWYRDRFHFEPLILDGEDYNEGGAAPLTFNTIDTSNLIDHIGALNLLVATAPLLANDMSAAIYTEKLVRSDSTYTNLFDNLLCGPLPTISMFLGLTLVDLVTNTSALSSGEEILFDAVTQHVSKESSQSRQLFTRIVWKRPIHMNNGLTPREAPKRVHFHPNGLATILYHIYLRMFENEDIQQMMSNISLLKLQRSSTPAYQRASFVAFVGMLRTTVDADWHMTFGSFLALIETNVSHLMTRNYIQELYVWLHLFDLYSVDALKFPLNCSSNNLRTRDLRDWKDMPPVVCVTLEVPRETLKVFTGGDVMKIGTPPLQCLIQGPSNGRPWQNIFGAVQIGFGKVESHGTPFSSSFEIGIVEDKAAWSGTSPLLTSFYAPAWILLLQPTKALVEFGIQSTPQSTQAFIGSLGLQLTVYQTTLSDAKHVYVSKNLPNQSAFISVRSYPVDDIAVPNMNEPTAGTTITATVDSATAMVASLAGRVNIVADDDKAALKAGARVTSISHTPFTFVTNLQPRSSFMVDFPVAVLESSLKTRVARKSSYIELISKVANGADWPTFRSFMYPVFLDSGIVVAWNMPSVNLQLLPILDTTQPAGLDWLTTHASMMFSARERSLRDNPSQQALAGERTRVEFKDSLFSLFMHYSGLQGQRAHVFGISCPTGGGVHIILFVSALRLDLSNRTVVLDAAALPLHNALMPCIASFLQALTNSGILCQIWATEAEMRLWKEILPALVERCRLWSHKPSCQYLTKRQVPLSVEKGERLLCSCGNGTVPTDFVKNVPSWNKVARHAVRVAISPSFSAAMFESRYDGGRLSDEVRDSKAKACRVCERDKKVDGSGLLYCGRCRQVKYCSSECQRADWETHKKVCKPS